MYTTFYWPCHSYLHKHQSRAQIGKFHSTRKCLAEPYKRGNTISPIYKVTMRFPSHLLVFSLLNLHGSLAFPSYGTLAGLSRSQLDAILPTLKRGVLEPPPGPLQDTSAKLVHDENHPFKPAGKHDIRGPCPGLNTLASHGVSLPIVGLNKRGSSDVDFLFYSGFREMELLLLVRSSMPFKKVRC